MSTISAADVKALRDKTNAPMMLCKSVLTEANGDMEKAIELIRAKSKDVQVAKGDREAAEGRIAAFIDSGKAIGALLEMRCESAPVAKSEPFVILVNDVVRQVALKAPATVDELLAQPFVDDPKKSINDRIADVIGLIRENIKPARFVRYSGQMGSYVHHDGSVGVMLQVEGAKVDEQILRDICMHITAKNPLAARVEDLPAGMVEKEREFVRSQIATDPKNKNKPANIVEMISEGKMKTWFAENVLLEQPFVKDDSKTVGQLLTSAGVKLVTYKRLKVGELS